MGKKKELIDDIEIMHSPPDRKQYFFSSEALLKHLPSPEDSTITRIAFLLSKDMIMVEVVVASQ